MQHLAASQGHATFLPSSDLVADFFSFKVVYTAKPTMALRQARIMRGLDVRPSPAHIWDVRHYTRWEAL